ncbi:MAG: hypothetical protein ACK4QW_14030 [Alphaproteobacteria bacterium]
MLRHASLAVALLPALLAGLLAGPGASPPALAQQTVDRRPAPGIWEYVRQDDIHKATVLDLSGFFQVQCKEAKVSIVVLVNSEGPLPTAGREGPIQAQLQFEGQTFPITMTPQPRYAGTSGPIHTTVYLLSVQDRGLEILAAIKRAHAFLIDQGPAVFAFSSRGSSAALGQLEKACTAG